MQTSSHTFTFTSSSFVSLIHFFIALLCLFMFLLSLYPVYEFMKGTRGFVKFWDERENSFRKMIFLFSLTLVDCSWAPLHNTETFCFPLFHLKEQFDSFTVFLKFRLILTQNLFMQIQWTRYNVLINDLKWCWMDALCFLLFPVFLLS